MSKKDNSGQKTQSESDKQIGNKKHKARRAFVASAITTGTLALAGIGVTIFLVAPSLVVSSVALVLAGVGAVTGVGVGISFAHTYARDKRYKKTGLDTLKTIAEASVDKTKNYSTRQKYKIATKYAKTNLKMCTTLGGTLTGKFRCVSDFSKDSQVETYNVIENMELLNQIKVAKNHHRVTSKTQKAEAKIKKKKALLPSLVKAPQRWKRTYDDFIEGVSIADHRTEIACLSETALDQFKQLSESIVPSTEVGGSVIVSFPEQSNNKIKQTFARIEDVNMLDAVKKLMVDDVLTACDTKSASEIASLFPITVREVVYNKKSVGRTRDAFTINSYEELVNYASSNELSR